MHFDSFFERGQSHSGELPQKAGNYWAIQDAKPIMPRVTINSEHETPELLAKSQCVRRLNETVLSLVARCGVSPKNILEWTQTQLEEHCAEADRRNAEEFPAMFLHS